MNQFLLKKELPSGNIVAVSGVYIDNMEQAREQVKLYYNGLMQTSSEHLKAKQHRVVSNLDKEIELCKKFLNETK